MNTASDVVKALRKHIEPNRVHVLSSFFKTGKGQYGEGDVFIGVTVPNNRSVAKQYVDLPLKEVSILLKDQVHECRLCALIILTYKVDALYMKSKDVDIDSAHAKIADLYMKHVKYINNWDLVDISAHKIVGRYLYTYKPMEVIEVLSGYAKSSHLWTKRIAMISTFYGIQSKVDIKTSNRKYAGLKPSQEPVYVIAKILLHDTHDLIQKAVGWMLREAGKRDLPMLLSFLDLYAQEMPRTTLRYAIERLSPDQKQIYMFAKKMRG